ncbi:MAG: hypothetical protein EA344_11375 [Alkalicoccus sp.]|nr:MAG: hypothetical protein EA344_11375 [Alkalicoccus sp.]
MKPFSSINRWFSLRNDGGAGETAEVQPTAGLVREELLLTGTKFYAGKRTLRRFFETPVEKESGNTLSDESFIHYR